MRSTFVFPLTSSELTSLHLIAVRHWPQYGMDRRTLQFKRHNISLIHDDDRTDAMRFLNRNNPMFAR